MGGPKRLDGSCCPELVSSLEASEKKRREMECEVEALVRKVSVLTPEEVERKVGRERSSLSATLSSKTRTLPAVSWRWQPSRRRRTEERPGPNLIQASALKLEGAT